jgi:hypothetical protein
MRKATCGWPALTPVVLATAVAPIGFFHSPNFWCAVVWCIGVMTAAQVEQQRAAGLLVELANKTGFTLLAALLVTGYTIVKSKRLSDFLDVLSDERASAWQKVRALGLVWRRTGE